MSLLIDTNGPISEQWIMLDDDQPQPHTGKLLVSMQRWRHERQKLLIGAESVGVILDSSTDVAELRAYLDLLELIVVRFDVFSDGRGFTQARLLRDRYGYEKAIRAHGDVLRDQLAFMARCGVTQFELENEDEVETALTAFSEISVGYQADLIRNAC